MEEETLYDRIGESDLNPTYKDGQVYQHTDVNNMLSILKTAVNENYHDIQKLENGTKEVGKAKTLDAATLSRYLDEILQADDNKVPSSQQAKAYIDNLFAEYSPPIRGVDYWTEEDKEEIIDETLEESQLKPKGDYDPTVEYKKLDIVLYQNSSYVALQTTQGNLPTDTDYWQVLVSGELSSEDIVDNLESNYSDKVLSAKQGKVLNEGKLQIFNTVANMKADTSLKAGMTVKTLGYHSINDKGSASYKVREITNEDVVDEATIIALYDNSLVAELILSNEMTPEVFGAYGNGTTDDSSYIQLAINNCGKVIFDNNKTYNIKNEIIVTNDTELDGNKCTIKMSRATTSSINIFNIDNTSNIKIHDFNLINGTDSSNNICTNIFISTNRPTTNYCYNIDIYNINYSNTDELSSVPLCVIFVGNVFGLNIHDCNLKNTDNNALRGIMVWSTEKIGDEYVNTESRYIHIYRNIVDGFYRNIESYGTSGTSLTGSRYEMIISDNHIKNATDTGIYAYHSEQSQILNNYVMNCKNGIWSDNGYLIQGNYLKAGEVGIWTEEFTQGSISSNKLLDFTNSAIIVGGGTQGCNIISNGFFNCLDGIKIDEQYTPNTFYSIDINITNNVFRNLGNHALNLVYSSNNVLFNNNNVHIWGLGAETAQDCIGVGERNNSGLIDICNNVFNNEANANTETSTAGNANSVFTISVSAQIIRFINNLSKGTMAKLADINMSQKFYFMNNIFETPTTSTLITHSDPYSQKYVIKGNMNLAGQDTLADRTGGRSL